MKSLFLILSVTLIGFQSCSEPEECECVNESVEMLKTSRKSNYADAPKGASSAPGCTKVSDNLKGRSKKEQDAAMDKMKNCSAYRELLKEQKLFEKHLQQQIQEIVQKSEEK